MTTGWETRKLGQLIERIETRDPSREPERVFEYVDVSAVSNKSHMIENSEAVLGANAPSRARRVIRTGDVIFATIRPTLSRTAIVPSSLDEQICSTGYFVARPRQTASLDSRFLFYFLLSADVQTRMETLQRGASYPAVSDADMREQLVPLPPLEEQKRIVAILDAAFADIDALAETTNVRLATAKRLFLSVLSDLYLGVGEAGGVTMVALGEFADHKLGKMLDKSKNRGTFKPYLRNANVRWFGFDLSDLSEMKIEEDERKRYEVRRGDLLICEGGYPGRCAIWQQTDEVYFQKAVHRVRFESDDLAPWVMYYLYFLDQTGKLSGSFSGTGIQHFTGQALHKFEVPLPEEGFRRAAIQRIERARQLIDESSKVIESKAERIVDLRQSLLHQAFSGQL